VKRALARHLRWVILAVALLILAFLAFSPVGKPSDNVRVMHLSPKLNRFQREMITSKLRGRSFYQPRYVSMRSDGPKFRAYLLDLSSINDSRAKVEAFMKASDQIERGQEPTNAPVKDKAVNVTEARFGLGWFPWSFTMVDYMLIVATDEEVTVEVRVNYGR
jgi:hypothetical protein